ncbi:aspartyl-phosphate phosphatase Spo0E family protein [Lentibacillus lipolyticus]|nr:aspartyl-phosphate phosphatase Spo0E family protein [Lentibacillus lipolyticus]
MDNQSRLSKEIEKSREEMVTMSRQYGRTSQFVIQASQRLDELLNQYQNS